MTKPTYGDLIRELRRRKSLNQTQLAELAGISLSTVQGVEGGSIRRPQKGTTDALHKALDLTTELNPRSVREVQQALAGTRGKSSVTVDEDLMEILIKHNGTELIIRGPVSHSVQLGEAAAHLTLALYKENP